MAQHFLSVEAPDTMNSCVLKLVDTSVYSPTVPYDCPILEITLPGFNYAIQFDGIEQNFILNLSACDLDIQTVDCGTSLQNLPDGIYIIKYSVAPNNLVYVEYNHLRITKALTCYKEALCELDIAACEPTAEIDKKMRDLAKIKSYLEAAKAKVEFCHEPKKGMELYNYAMKLLSKFDCKTCH
jgi:hypothetical protein